MVSLLLPAAETLLNPYQINSASLLREERLPTFYINHLAKVEVQLQIFYSRRKNE